MDNIGGHKQLVVTQALLHFLRVNAQMCNLDIAKNGARPENVSCNYNDEKTT